MGRVAQWASALMAVAVFAYTTLVTLIVAPDTLVSLWKNGQLAVLVLLMAASGSISLMLWLYRGRPGRPWTGVVVACVSMVAVVSVGLWIKSHNGDVEVQEVHLDRGEFSESSSPSDKPELPPMGSHMQPPAPN